MCAEFKALAKDEGIAVLLLSQLNRTGATSERPQLHHLRDSGAIEQDADNVLFIHRPNKREEADDVPEAASIILAKCRNGPTGTAQVTWEPVRMRFTEAVQGPEPPPASELPRDLF